MLIELVELQLGFPRAQGGHGRGLSSLPELAPAHHTTRRFGPDVNEVTKLWQSGACQCPDITPIQLGTELADNRRICCVSKSVDQDQRLALGLAQDVLELEGAVQRIDADQDGADLGGGELDHHPRRRIGRPNPDTVPFLNAEAQKPTRDNLDFIAQLPVREAPALVPHDQAALIRHARRGRIENLSDAFPYQRDLGRPATVAYRTPHVLERKVVLTIGHPLPPRARVRVDGR